MLPPVPTAPASPYGGGKEGSPPPDRLLFPRKVNGGCGRLFFFLGGGEERGVLKRIRCYLSRTALGLSTAWRHTAPEEPGWELGFFWRRAAARSSVGTMLRPLQPPPWAQRDARTPCCSLLFPSVPKTPSPSCARCRSTQRRRGRPHAASPPPGAPQAAAASRALPGPAARPPLPRGRGARAAFPRPPL